MRKTLVFVFVVAFVATLGVWAPSTTNAQEPDCVAPTSFEQFAPDSDFFDGMLPVTETFEDFLVNHALTADDIQEFSPQDNMWEPGLFVVELHENLYGNYCLTLLPGYIYTVSLPDGRVEPFWGGDPNLEEVPVQWGFTARWVPAYSGKLYGLGGWLDPEDMTEFLVREHRFGRYLRNEEQMENRDDVPFFNRFGPYYVGTGNVETDWVPPALSATIPNDYRDAAAMLGGLARESEWTRGSDQVWVWKYTDKVAGSDSYCAPTAPCWQTAYVPSHSEGYVEIWHDGGPKKFYADDLQTLADGNHNVDEFSYHPFED